MTALEVRENGASFWWYWSRRDLEIVPGYDHIAMPVLTPSGRLAMIDCGILDIMRELWACHIETRNSCQGGGLGEFAQPGYVQFNGDASVVADIVESSGIPAEHIFIESLNLVRWVYRNSPASTRQYQIDTCVRFRRGLRRGGASVNVRE